MIVRSSTNNPLGKRPLNFMADRYGLGAYEMAPVVVLAPPAPGPNLAMLAIAGAALYFFFVKGK